jgi:uncharacterized protein YndB with AHSA1/START domain
MLPTSETACFVIADISGYTSFLARVELEHAQDIIADVMATVLKNLRPQFRVAKFEGDAVFLYAVGDRLDGSPLQDAIESAYFAFRRRLRNIKQSTICECSACRQMQSLDLKFVGHHGAFVRQKMGGREELAGSDVILVHRLLKNSVNERLGGHAYALYSQACVSALGIDPVAQGLAEHSESVDVIGDIGCWVRDLEAAWTSENGRQRHEVTAETAAMVLDFEIHAPRPMVWDYFVMPELRPKWRGADKVLETTAGGGRRGLGTTNHCMHGAHAIIEEILDWRPHDYLTLSTLLPIPGAPKIVMTYAFFDLGGGTTRAEIRVARPKSKDKAFVAAAAEQFQKTITGEVAVLRALISGTGEPASAEPEPPVSAGRYVTQPVHAG